MTGPSRTRVLHPTRTTEQSLTGATNVASRMIRYNKEWRKEHPDWETNPDEARKYKPLQQREALQIERMIGLVERNGRENARQRRHEERHARHEEHREQRREERHERRENARAERNELRKIVEGLSQAIQHDVEPIPLVSPVWQTAKHAVAERQYTYLANNAATKAVSVAAQRKLDSVQVRASRNSVMPWDTPPELPVSAPTPSRPPPLPSTLAPSVLRSALPEKSAVAAPASASAPSSTPAPSVLRSSPAESPTVAAPASASAPASKPLLSPFRYVKRSALSDNTPDPIATPPIAASSAATKVVDYPNYGRVPATAIPPLDSPAVASPSAVIAPTTKPAPKPASIYASSIDALYKKGEAGDKARAQQALKDNEEVKLRAKGYHPETFHPDYGKIPEILRTTRDAVRRDNQQPVDGQYAKLPTAPTTAAAPAADNSLASAPAASLPRENQLPEKDGQYAKLPSAPATAVSPATDNSSASAPAAGVQRSDLASDPQLVRDRIKATGAFTEPAPGRTTTFIPAGHSEYGNFGFISNNEPPPGFKAETYLATSPAIAAPAAPMNTDNYAHPPSNPGYDVLPPGIASSDSNSQWSAAGHDGSDKSSGSEAIYDRVDPLPLDEAKANESNLDLPPITDAEAHAADARYRQDRGQFSGEYGMLPDEGPPAQAATSSTTVTRPRANAVTSADPETIYSGMPSSASQSSLSSNSSASSVKGAEVSGAVSSVKKVDWGMSQASNVNARQVETPVSQARAQASKPVMEKLRDIWRFMRGKNAAASNEINNDNDNDKSTGFQRGPSRN